MPIGIDIIRAREFIRIDPSDDLDFEASKNMLQKLALACRKRAVDHAILDLRDLRIPAQPRFSPTQLAALVGAFREAGFSRPQRLAILFGKDTHGRIRTFAFLSKMRGLEVEAFNDFETAFHWLSEGQQDGADEYRGAGVRIKRDAKT